jgi:effector-binding domain-containing protein
MLKISYEIQKNIIINKSHSEISSFLSDFRKSKLWNPWLVLDDEGVTDDKNLPNQVGHQQHWKGPIIGEGIQTLTAISDHRVDIELRFIKPFKTISPTYYLLNSIDNNSTELIWSMKGSLPFFLFFFRKFMTVMLSRDFERGLDRLKELCEDGKVFSSLSVVETIDVKDLYYQGIEGKCKLSEIPTRMRRDFEKISQDIREMKIYNFKGMVSVYHEINPMKNFVHYTAGFYFENPPEKIEGYNDGLIREHRALTLISKGPYHHLKSAWTKIFSFQRVNKLKIISKIPMLEFMLNDPTNVPKEEIKTEIQLAIK